MTFTTINFDLNSTGSYIEGDYRIYPNTKCFQAGDYKDKGIKVDILDLKKRVSNFVPLEFNVEHTPTDDPESAHSALKGCFGCIEEMWIDPDDAAWARGRAKIPLTLDGKLSKHLVSMEVPYEAGKPFSGAAITYNPRIAGAAMMSANEIVEMGRPKKERHDTMEGQTAAQHYHDYAAARGAICKDPATNSKKDMSLFAAKHEMQMHQDIHDLAIEHGAQCSSYNPEVMNPYYGVYNATPKPQEKRMAFSTAKFVAWLKGEGVVIEDDVVPPAVPSADFSKREAELKAEFAATAAKLEADMKAIEEKHAADFAQAQAEANKVAVFALVEAHKIDPADVPKYEALRAGNPAVFDGLALKMPVLAHLASPKELITINEQNAAALMGNSPKTPIAADEARLRSSIDYGF